MSEEMTCLFSERMKRCVNPVWNIVERDYVVEYVDNYYCQHLNDMTACIIKSLVKAIDARDKNTGQHSQNVAQLMVGFAKRLGLTKQETGQAYIAGLVHDIGKIGIPENILNKPARLTTEEFASIKQHPDIGANILSGIIGLQKVVEVVRHHHERYDGCGYPDGIQGQRVPVLSRMLALCDSYDAMTTPRCYREPFTCDRALAEIQDQSGLQFDPEFSQVFINLMLESDSAICP